ncbi:hypothetical protein [Halorarius litoreus]|uniref:hypothetical protein n=1 Tax=Halorarius litoreus TaxID=2962676 RepID=UPI0020CE1A14|nr:hypothetical protein [Halorarius litoreus]
MALPDEPLTCDCGVTVAPEAATRTETFGDLDPTTWQSLCCPECGRKLKTVFVGDE